MQAINSAISGFKKVDSFTRLYIWSLILDPLLFFILFEKSTTGVSGNLSKLLQLFVFILLGFRILINISNVKVPNLFSTNYKYYTLFFLAAVFSGVIGIQQGAYDTLGTYEKQENFSAISKFINGANTRSVFEYIIAFYNFIYFVIFPIYIIKTESALNFFFKYFILFFKAGLILGIIDLALILFFNIEFIPRHLSDGVHPGSRFHGLAGEPRDAFVYLLLGAGILNLKTYLYDGKLISKNWILLICLLLILTQSGSGILGLLFSALLLLFFLNDRITLMNVIKIVTLLIFISLVAYIAISSSDRLKVYIEVFPAVWEAIGDSLLIPPVYLGQMSNIYPLWDLYNNVINHNLMPIFLGRGMGSASAVSNRIGNVGELFNAHSQLVRLLYESGLIGLFFFIKAFLYPVKLAVKQIDEKYRKSFIIMLIILLGAFFGHRSNCLFIYLGIFLVSFKQLNKRQIVNVNTVNN